MLKAANTIPHRLYRADCFDGASLRFSTEIGARDHLVNHSKSGGMLIYQPPNGRARVLERIERLKSGKGWAWISKRASSGRYELLRSDADIMTPAEFTDL
jgi:hypothetical protein